MDKVQKHNSFSTYTPSSESYKNDLKFFAFLFMFEKLHAHARLEIFR
jgi:hypothetical protein